MSRGRHRRRQDRDWRPSSWDAWDRTITPGTGSLGIEGQPAEKSAPVITPVGTSRQTKAYIISCEHCEWTSAEEPNVNACHHVLLDHARAVHLPWVAASVSVRIRSGKHRCPIEQIDP